MIRGFEHPNTSYQLSSGLNSIRKCSPSHQRMSGKPCQHFTNGNGGRRLFSNQPSATLSAVELDTTDVDAAMTYISGDDVTRSPKPPATPVGYQSLNKNSKMTRTSLGAWSSEGECSDYTLAGNLHKETIRNISTNCAETRFDCARGNTNGDIVGSNNCRTNDSRSTREWIHESHSIQQKCQGMNARTACRPHWLDSGYSKGGWQVGCLISCVLLLFILYLLTSAFLGYLRCVISSSHGNLLGPLNSMNWHAARYGEDTFEAWLNVSLKYREHELEEFGRTISLLNLIRTGQFAYRLSIDYYNAKCILK